MSKKQVILSNTDRANFMLAGKAALILRSRKTNTELRYFIVAPKKNRNAPKRFVYAKIDEKWYYIGTIYTNGKTKPFYHGRRSKISYGHLVVKGFSWLWYKVVRNEKQDKIDVLHIGRCGRCKRKLTDPTSLRRGLGPKCHSLSK